MSEWEIPLALLIGITAGFMITLGTMRIKDRSRKAQGRDEADQMLSLARDEADKILRNADQKSQEDSQRRTRQLDKDLAKRRHEFEKTERKVAQLEGQLEKRLEAASQREGDASRIHDRNLKAEATLRARNEAVEASLVEARRRCENTSGMTAEEAKKTLLDMVEADVRQDMAAMVRRIEGETKEIAGKKARQIITLAIQKCASEQVAENTVSVIHLPSDEMKGRIIGKEGRNIRALEAATGCNIIVDETPEAVVLSCFDPLRREVARLSLERLMGDGRIHPGRIEEVVAKVEKDLADVIREAGEQTVFDLGIANMHPELIKTIGRLKYRTSYGQNILQHSIETARLAGFLAAELGADIETAKRSGLLHDIGKALSYEMEGTHALIGADLAKKCNEAPGVVHAIAAHHNEEEPRTIVAVLIQAADAISSARPGVRRESLANYVKRMERLEEIALEFKGVVKAYAFQAGRELRTIVEPGEVNDNEAALLAREIAKKIEKELEYPGQIKVTVVRELRATEYAK